MKVISLINMKGGVGKTTMAINIAHCLVKRHGKKVLVIDIDPQFNATQSLLSPEEYMEHLKNEYDTIANVFDRQTRTVVESIEGISGVTPKTFSEIKPVEVIPDFFLLPGNLNLYRIEMASGEGREYKLLKYINEICQSIEIDYVVIDTPPTPSIWMTSALIASNYYLIPVKPEPLSFTGIDLLEKIIDDKRENLDLKIDCAGVIFTITESNTKVFDEAKAFIQSKPKWRDKLFKRHIPKRTKIARHQTNKLFILDLPDPDAKSSLTGIVDELLDRIEQRNEQE